MIRFLGLIFLACVFFSLGRRASEVSPPVPQPILDPPPAEIWSVDPPPIAFPSSAFSSGGPSQIQTQQQTVIVYPSVAQPYDYNWWAQSPSLSQAVRNLGTQRPPPLRRFHR